MSDTIFAEATARGKAGVAVVRLSGPGAHVAVQALAGDLPPARQARLRVLRADTDILDEALVLTFDAGASFTGEAVAELHLHGSRAVVAATLAALGQMPGLRPAEPGEFTRRALVNGRLDLTEIDGLGDLIDAETAAQRKQAQTVMAGALREAAEDLRRDLIRAAALLEASIDFADEDVPEDVVPEVTALLGRAEECMRQLVAGSYAAERIRDGFEVAIVGAPNVGKSTLLNRLAGREAAITSDVAGTTRDVIEVQMDLQGLPVTILDTAGLRDSEDTVEQLGVARARDRAEAADLRVFLTDADEMPEAALVRPDDIVLRSKADQRAAMSEGAVSGLTGAGVNCLIERIVEILSGRAQQASVATRDRHRVAFQDALAYLDAARVKLANGPIGLDLAAAELRMATAAIDQVIGRVDVESLLDEIFSSFCIGK
ncbi:MAG: tRNA uridine-5-carboxymethylaminomethyl(34) synthesis GTPase MnmE [Rhodobacteraceae bacterium]|nr:tRNA uridine-5-carboxymethylaminomethyl(34) synthesis GTPase MnmE [Paracoccaceae bacterium]